MSLKRIAVCVIVAFVIIEVRSQVCTKQVQTSTRRTYSYVTTEKLCENCVSRQQIKTKSKLVNITAEVVECCHGYTRLDNNLEASSTNCLKVDQTPQVRGCSETCQNGECSETNECICYESYEQYPPGSNTCVDKCDPGYDRINGLCKPRCTKPCHGGYCAAPEECLCHTGWEKNEQGKCTPTCTPGCGNGTCVNLNMCTCPNGYELRNNANPQCVLKCYSGYERINGYCQPRCTKPCHGGYCSAPDKCNCHTGWKKNEQGECIPTCNPECGNGTCIDVNKCSCWYGYELRKSTNPQCVLKCDPGYDKINGLCKPRCTKPCYGGYCAAPEECLCHTGWKKNEQGECIPTCNPECGNGTCIDVHKCSCWYGYELIKNANPQCVTTEVTSESTVTNINAYNHSPIPTKSAPISTDVKKHKSSTERHDEKSTQPDGNGSPTLLYAAVGANIILLIIIISIILYKNPAIYKRFQASNCTKKTREDGEVLHYDYVQLPLPIRTREENVYSI